MFVLLQEHCLIDLLHSWQDGRLPVDITRVIRWTFWNVTLFILYLSGFKDTNYDSSCIRNSNHDRFPNTHVVRFLERNSIPYHYLGTSKENNREDEILDLVQNTDFLVLARYMQVNMMIRSIVPLLLTSCMPN